MSLPSEIENRPSSPVYAYSAIGLLIVVAIATAASWRLYPVFIDTYYHMAVIEGFSQAGGISTWAFWEMAPGGRVHIYPPSLHVIGYFFHLMGMSTGTFLTLVSATLYVGCLATTWIWLRRVIGDRSALFALVLLCGPWAFVSTQATFQAVAGVMVLAPLAFLALEKERFLTCGVLNMVACTMHPMGLFLPPALVINTLLRRKKIIAGLLAASIPVLLYSPWLAHIWANRAFLPENRTGGEITLGGVGGGANLGVLLVPLALLAIPWLMVRRGPALGLVGALLGFAVVFPMGFGSRFLSFNIHWPLACLAGYGLGATVAWLEKYSPIRAAVQVVSVVVALVALITYPALSLPLGGPGSMDGRQQEGKSTMARLRSQVANAWSNRRFSVEASALPKLFETYSGEGLGMGIGPGGLPGMGPGGGGPGGPPGMGPGGRGMGPGGPGMGPGNGGFRMGPGMGPPGMGPGGGGPPWMGPGNDRGMGQGSRGPGNGPGGPGMGPPDFGPGGGDPTMGLPDMGPDDEDLDVGPLEMGATDKDGGTGEAAVKTPEKKVQATITKPKASDNRSPKATPQPPWEDDEKKPQRPTRDKSGRDTPQSDAPQRGAASQPAGGRDRDQGQRAGGGRAAGQRQGGGRGVPGGPGGNLLSRTGAQEFFDAVKNSVALGDVVYMDDGAAANLIVGATGRWTTSGILRDVRSEQRQIQPDKCDFAIVLTGGGMPGPGGPMGGRSMPSSFKKVFENDYGTLYENPVKVEHNRQPHKAEVSLSLLSLMTLVGFLLVIGDFWLPRRPWYRRVAGGLGTLIAALCLIPLASAAVSELRNPPAAPPWGGDGPPGFGGPRGPGPGFGGPGFGPGQFLVQAFLRESHPHNEGSVTLLEFKALAGRWWDAWDTNHDGKLSEEEMSAGLATVVEGPGGMGGPIGPPGSPFGGPAEVLLQKLFLACDADSDGKVTREEMIKGFEKLFRQWDTESRHSLDSGKIGNGLEQLLGPPPMF